MKLSRASSYALQAVAFMAAKKSEDPVASHLIAQARGIPERFLLKVLKPLVSARVLRSVKGPNGGYQLAKPANHITMLEVVEAVEGPMRGHAPMNDSKTDGPLQKKLEAIVKQSADQTRRHLEKVTLAELSRK
jgi:Rrf2 family protein